MTCNVAATHLLLTSSVPDLELHNVIVHLQLLAEKCGAAGERQKPSVTASELDS